MTTTSTKRQDQSLPDFIELMRNRLRSCGVSVYQFARNQQSVNPRLCMHAFYISDKRTSLETQAMLLQEMGLSLGVYDERGRRIA